MVGAPGSSGNVQGAEFVTESLAEYSALMVLKQKYGDARMHRFLKYELDRYLLGRGTEQKGEQPLLRADGAAYVHYQKGALALYALQDAIGEDAMNDALSAFVGRWRFKGPPYATSRDLLAELRRVTPAAQQSLIEDFFETITLYDDRAVSAKAHKRPDGKYDIDLVVSARKIRADAAGNEQERHSTRWSTSACSTLQAIRCCWKSAACTRARIDSRCKWRAFRRGPGSIRWTS